MIFALLTLLAALSLAAVAGWFSIIGIMSIYAGAAFHALIMGIVLEAGKLVTTSWLYRNWNYSNWSLKAPLIAFTIALMVATSIGVFGFLSKSHLEQGAGTVDNSAKVERLEQQIAREKSTIADDDKVIAQLDAAINSYIGKDRTDKSIAVRKSQDPQRKQLRADIDAAQKRIDTYSDERLKLQSEVRKLQLDVGPIRYIAELIYGTDGNTDKNIEAAVRVFTLLIVSILDPLAIVLLIAANHTIMRRENEKKENLPSQGLDRPSGYEYISPIGEEISEAPNEGAQTSYYNSASEIRSHVSTSSPEPEENTVHVQVLPEAVGLLDEKEVPTLEKLRAAIVGAAPPSRSSPSYSQISQFTTDETPAQIEPIVEEMVSQEPPQIKSRPQQDAIIREILGNSPHFIPQKVHEEEKPTQVETPAATTAPTATGRHPPEIEEIQQKGQRENALPQEIQGVLISSVSGSPNHKYPKALSWLKEFKRSQNG